MQTTSLYEKYLQSRKVSTDTRQIAAGSLFFALRGPKYNANAFASEALEKGAAYAVVDDKAFVKNDRYILVDDVLTTLQHLARYHRQQLKIPVIGITGSNGKTTSKELLAAVLSTKYNVYSTPGNLNNHIGVPLTVLSIDPAVELAVVEMGANHVGEIASLCEIANPTHGLITNIGRAHIGTFGGFENIVRAKSELYQHLLTHSGTVFINSQNPTLTTMAKRFKDPVFYPSASDFYHCELIGADPLVSVRAENEATVATHLVGSYNFENVAAALCIGKYFGIDATAANESVRSYEPRNMRSQVIRKATNLIVLDAYNANPTSMKAAIESLAQMKATRKIAILGDMYELGEDTGQEHRMLGTVLSDNGIDEVYLCGPLIKPALETCRSAMYFGNREELIQFLHLHPIADAVILVKASRGMGLEKIVEAL